MVSQRGKIKLLEDEKQKLVLKVESLEKEIERLILKIKKLFESNIITN